ncbi:uncharacterized protein [Macrobrachium rosenbergii]|uniref:uncharacterized protein n=1 Tax=Macrobrachium rosenbergii TaxID=79674 RepID=UPI0034D69098
MTISTVTVSTSSRNIPTSLVTTHIALVMCPQVLPSTLLLGNVFLHILLSKAALNNEKLKKGTRKSFSSSSSSSWLTAVTSSPSPSKGSKQRKKKAASSTQGKYHRASSCQPSPTERATGSLAGSTTCTTAPITKLTGATTASGSLDTRCTDTSPGSLPTWPARVPGLQTQVQLPPQPSER